MYLSLFYAKYVRGSLPDTTNRVALNPCNRYLITALQSNYSGSRDSTCSSRALRLWRAVSYNFSWKRDPFNFGRFQVPTSSLSTLRRLANIFTFRWAVDILIVVLLHQLFLGCFGCISWTIEYGLAKQAN